MNKFIWFSKKGNGEQNISNTSNYLKLPQLVSMFIRFNANFVTLLIKFY